MKNPSVNSIVERLQFDAARCELQFSKGVAENISEAATIISELQAENERLKQDMEDRLKAWTRAMHGKLDAESSLSRIKEETIEECARIAEQTGNFGDYRRDELTADYGQPRFDMMNAIASAIRSLGSTGGAEKTAESGNPAPTRERE